METYRTTAPVTLPVGALLMLSPAQASARAHGLTKEADGWRVRLPVQFKAGEEFGYAGELPKAMADQVTPNKAGPAKSRRAD